MEIETLYKDWWDSFTGSQDEYQAVKQFVEFCKTKSIPNSDLKELKDITDEIEKILSEFNSVHFTTEQIQETSKRIAVYFPVQRAEPDGWVYESRFYLPSEFKVLKENKYYSAAKPVYFSPLPSVNEKEAVEDVCSCKGKHGVMAGKCTICNKSIIP